MRKHLLLYVSTITHFSESTSSKYLFPRTVSDQNSPVRLWFPQAFRFSIHKTWFHYTEKSQEANICSLGNRH